MGRFWEIPRLLLFFLIVVSLPALGQKGGGGGGGGSHGGGGGAGGKGGGAPVSGSSGIGAPISGSPNNFPTNPWPPGTCSGLPCSRPLPATPSQDDPTCFLSLVQGIQSPTVSVTLLQVPQKAREEYEQACEKLQHKKYAAAEKHLEKAVGLYSGYAAAWVLLGQVQEIEHKTNEASESCNRAMKIDSNYAPPYLCLAHLIATQNKWKDLSELSGRLLELHPLHASSAYYYNALASFYLNNLSSAETTALRGTEDSKQFHRPELHLLLADIYEKKGDRAAEISQLREYLKRAPHGVIAEQVNKTLKGMANNTTAQAVRP
jgi:Tetratricopeptide repeat